MMWSKITEACCAPFRLLQGALTGPLKAPSQTGFTILEVLFAITILAVMITLTYSSLESILRSKEIIEDEQEFDRLELSLTKRLSRELQLAYPGIPRLPPPDDLERRYSASENMLGTEGSMPNGRPGDSITFIALSAGQNFLADKLANNGIVQLTYSLREDPTRERRENYPVYSLIREEVPFERPFEKAYEKAIRFPLVDYVEGLQIEFFDLKNNEWSRTWGDEERRDLPSMVRFFIEVRTPKGVPKVISATLPLRARRQPQ